MRPDRQLAALAVVLLGPGLAACTASSAPAAPTVTHTNITHTDITHTDIVTLSPRARTTAPAYHPPQAVAVRPLPPGADPARGEVERRCPYIRTGLDQDADPHGANVADIEGDRIYRTTVLTGRRPVGCRFYFYAPPYEAVADIVARRFPTATDAHNALVLTAEAGTEPISAPDFLPGIDGISYRTRFFAADGASDWAFAFAKGPLLVVVRTQRSDTSRPAVYLARAIAARI